MSLADVQALARMWVWLVVPHIQSTAAPVLALAVQTVPVPEPATETVVAVPAAPQLGVKTEAAPER